MSLRLSELQLRRALGRIVFNALGAPLTAVVACHSGGSVEGGAKDGAVAEPTPSFDASVAEEAAAPDATLADGGGGVSEACAPYGLDGAAWDDAGCIRYQAIPCGLPADAALQGCLVDLASCVEACGRVPAFQYCELAPWVCSLEAGIVPDASLVLECVSCPGAGGRRPRGLRDPRARRRSVVGDHFGALAHMEAASVRAFRDLERDLARLGAPEELRAAAVRAASDERRHARAMRRLSRRFGGEAPRPRVRKLPPPSLLGVLLEGAREGCVAETYGALLATWQAQRAEDPWIRRTMRAVAGDETRHAALAWEVLRWGRPLLGERDRVRLDRALEAALASLRRRPPAVTDLSFRRAAGYPAPEEEEGLLAALEALVEREVMRQRPRPATSLE
jgi:hypothetical protein